jgi:hypothetical protein
MAGDVIYRVQVQTDTDTIPVSTAHIGGCIQYNHTITITHNRTITDAAKTVD